MIIEIERKKQLHFQIWSSLPTGVKVLNFHYFGNLDGQMKTRYNNAFGEKRKR